MDERRLRRSQTLVKFQQGQENSRRKLGLEPEDWRYLQSRIERSRMASAVGERLGGYNNKTVSPDRSPMTADSVADKHRLKMERRKQVQDQRLAQMKDRKGLIIVNTGDGKGKSSAAFGVVFRTLGHGLKVGVVQFIKGAWQPGEAKLLKSMNSELVEFYALGEGFTWETQDRDRDIVSVQKAWQTGLRLLTSGDCHVVLLDEINIAVKLGYLAIETVLAGLQQKTADTHAILTGRGAKPELIEMADLVTEMTSVKHPFREQGIKAQLGIEY